MSTATLQRLAPPESARHLPLHSHGSGRWDASGSFVVPEGATASLGTWANAFPAAWWRRLAGVRRVAVAATGTGEVTVRTARAGRTDDVVAATVDGAWRDTLDVGDADWAWVEVRGPAAIRGLRWLLDGVAEPRQEACVTAVVPTYLREQDVLDQARRHLDAPPVARVVVVDQGGTLGSDPAFERLLDAAGGRLVLLEQDNLGGSGGYARGMLESRRWPGDAVLLSDDDARLPAEALRRMVVAQELALGRTGRPTMIGTGMLSAERPTQLVALAEHVSRRRFMWGASDGLSSPLDLAVGTPADWSALRPEAPVDYVGWWGALLPTGSVDRVGLPAPYFLKWDDAEYGLRARRRGVDAAVIPGTGVWHPTWAAKATISSWSAFPLHRNRLATAAAYGAGPGVLLDSLVHQVKHVLSLQYATAGLWDAALVEVGAGSEAWLGHDLRTVRARAQRLLDRERDTAAAPPGRLGATAAPGLRAPRSAPLGAALWRAATGLVRPVRRDPAHVVHCAAEEFGWRVGLGADVVVLTDDAGAVTDVLTRQPARARRLLGRSLRHHATAFAGWRSTAADYRTALAPTTTAAAWRARLRADENVA